MIDAHCHVWTLSNPHCTWPGADLPAIHRDFSVPDAARLARPMGVTGCILVQSQEDAADTDWLLAQAEAYPFVAGVVGWLDMTAPRAAERILQLRDRNRCLCGVRPMLQDRPPGWLLDDLAPEVPAAMTASGLVFEALVRPEHLPSLMALARRYPALPIMIDHAAKPQPASFAVWRAAIAEIAREPNVCCKFSGVVTEAADRAHVQAVADTVLEHFGEDRVVWGSDWPVLNLASNYSGWLALAQRLVPQALHHAVFRDNAVRIYGLAI